jgi:hypothetical protein
MDVNKARTRFAELRAQGGKVAPEDLDEIWAALPPTRVEDILGAWKGDEFNTGHPNNGQLKAVGWYGKTFNSLKDAKPMICRGEDGTLFSNLDYGNGGEASLWMVEFRGESTATMVYDRQPVFDHFKQVDGNTLLGIMNRKDITDEGPFFYFLLERV